MNSVNFVQYERLAASMKKIEQELLESRRREAGLMYDKLMLEQTVSALNTKMAELVKSFEDIQYSVSVLYDTP